MPELKLLLVLDKATTNLLHTPLFNLGYRVIENPASNEQAIEIIEKQHPDLLFVQLHVNENLGGTQFGERVYTQYDIPVIYISDQSSQATIRRSRGTAPFGYIFSPADEKQIMATIEVAFTRHRMEKNLRESKQWLNGIVQCISDSLVVVDTTDRIHFINPGVEELTGLHSADILDRPLDVIFTLYNPDSEERITLSYSDTLLQNPVFPKGLEAVLLRRDGKRVPVEISISPLNENNIQIGMVLVIRNITNQKKALQDIRAAAMRSEAMLKAAKQLNSRLDIRTVLNTVSDICNKSFNVAATAAFLFSSNHDSLVIATLNGNQPGFLDDLGDPRYELQVQAFERILSVTKPVMVIQDIHSIEMPGAPFWEKLKEKNVCSAVIAGMYHNKALIGVLIAPMVGKVCDFTPEELDLLRGLADEASIAVSNAVLFDQVVTSRETQQKLSRRLVDLQEDLKRNLARELHDQIGQMLTGLQFSISALLPTASKEQKEMILELKKQVSLVIAQTREISLNLHPSMLEDTGLLLTLAWHIDRFTSQTGIKVNFHHYNMIEKRFKPEIEIAIFRILQEALTNAARYAKVDSVEVMLMAEEKLIKMDIQDQGQGFDINNVDKTSHMGLSSMRERAYAVGGFLEIFTEPGKGTQIHTVIPITGKVERRHNERLRFSR